ncbi:glycosyltransferase involved in cell wall biosynthesis [Agrobacterium vitis]|nr:glycosyltransferase involved in cell wall biosynthesis [Agrobacterium vitis]MBE1437475.1 glycosyltransferase involved in cell wall biosynthesis [Agrobacterium vitis]
MTKTPTLSICVPSRNRQYYFQKTIEGLLRNKRDDVEFVFTDNSDDPSIMNDFMVEIVKDPRVVYLPSTGATLSMMDNWERTIVATRGEWVTFIGDDDFIDPDVAGLIVRVARVSPQTEAFSWGTLTYAWPHEDVKPSAVLINFEHAVMKVPKIEPMKRMFGWVETSAVPTSGYSIYHSAIRRRLLDRIYIKYGHRYFQHAVVDYDMAMKVICEAEGFAYSKRQFSVFGACPESNSFSIGRLEDTKRKAQIFMDEFGNNFEDDPALRNFPFSSFLGVTATIGVTQQWFCEKYGIHYHGWEQGYAKACALNTETYRDKEAFDIINAGYEKAFRNWKGGKFLKYYKPVWRGDTEMFAVSGAKANGILIQSDIAGAKTPVELWDVVLDMITPVDNIIVPEKGLLFPWQQDIVSGDLLKIQSNTADERISKSVRPKPIVPGKKKRR